MKEYSGGISETGSRRNGKRQTKEPEKCDIAESVPCIDLCISDVYERKRYGHRWDCSVDFFDTYYVFWYMGASAGFGNELPNKGAFIAMYTLSVAFYMPTLALSNTTAFTILKNNGLDTVKDFPPIRVLGTVGFIVTMWFVNCAVWDNGSFGFTLGENAHKFQYTYMQFFVSGVLSLVLFLYTLTLPAICFSSQSHFVSRRV